MKKNRIVILSIVFSILFSFQVLAGQWKQDDKGWYYQNDDGSYIMNDWFLDPGNGNTYYFDTFGYMRTGLSYIKNQWYNFRDDGSLIFNFYSPDNPHISTNDGSVVSPDTPGITLGVCTATTNERNSVGFIVVNMRNVPITVYSTCQISDVDFTENFYLYTENGFVDKVVIQPGEKKALIYVAPDLHPINVKNGETTARYDLLCEDEEYWIRTPIYSLDTVENEFYIEHIKP